MASSDECAARARSEYVISLYDLRFRLPILLTSLLNDQLECHAFENLKTKWSDSMEFRSGQGINRPYYLIFMGIVILGYLFTPRLFCHFG